MSESKHNKLLTKIASIASAKNLSGIVINVTDKRNTFFEYAKGYANIDAGLMLDNNCLFRIGSVTKPFVATAILRLCEQQRLNLDIPIEGLSTKFRRRYWPYSNKITPRMLLCHKSGLPQDAGVFGPRDGESLGKFVVNQIPLYKPRFPPGIGMQYSNLGYCVLGYIIETVCNMDFGCALKELVFKPLEMSSTTFDPLVAMTYKVASPHSLSSSRCFKVVRSPLEDTRYHPAGFAFSTATDLCRFLRMLMTNGVTAQGRFLSDSSVSEMLKIHSQPFLKRIAGYGLGIEVNPLGNCTRFEHHGTISTYRALVSFIPQLDIGMSILTNGEVEHSFLNQICETIAKKLGCRRLRHRITYQKLILPKGFDRYYSGINCGILRVKHSLTSVLAFWNGEKIILTQVADSHFGGKSQRTGQSLEIGFLHGFLKSRFLLINGNLVKALPKAPRLCRQTIKQKYIGVYQSDFEKVEIFANADGLWLRQIPGAIAFEIFQNGPRNYFTQIGILRFASDSNFLTLGVTRYYKTISEDSNKSE